MIEQSGHSTHSEKTDVASSAVWQFAEDVAGALLTPVTTLRSIGERRAVVSAIVLVALITLLGSSGQLATILLSFGQLAGIVPEISGGGTGAVAALQVSAVVGNLVWAPVFWTITAAIVYGVAYVLGGRGSFMALWAATGFALAPQLLLAPLSSATDLLNWVGTGWQLLGWLFVFPVTIAVFVWTLVLYVIAVRETMALSTGQAVASIAILISAAILLVVLLICAFLLVIFAIAALVAA